MASSAMKIKPNGFCLVDLGLKGNKYESNRLNVFFIQTREVEEDRIKGS